MKNFLIFGANFINKGAESMLFVTISELRRRFPNCIIYFGTQLSYRESEFKIIKLYCPEIALDIAMHESGKWKKCFYGLTYETVKVLMRRKCRFENIFNLGKIIDTIDAILDISGFALGSKWSQRDNELYLKRIQVAIKYQKPIYLLPQSFGPFDFYCNYTDLLQNIKHTLQYPRIIFAREQEGYDILVSNFKLKNVILSSDLVLQNKKINISDIFNSDIIHNLPDMSTGKGEYLVGIVPNSHCFTRSNNEITEIYKAIINNLLQKGYKVIIFRHSREDLICCKQIKSMFKESEQVILIEHEFSSLEYSEFVKRFRFLICSRYHGIVHAYRQNVPCIILGWAIKYIELAHRMGQEYYVFNLIDNHVQIDDIVEAVNEMSENILKNKKIIHELLCLIQNQNCFNLLESDFLSLK